MSNFGIMYSIEKAKPGILRKLRMLPRIAARRSWQVYALGHLVWRESAGPTELFLFIPVNDPLSGEQEQTLKLAIDDAMHLPCAATAGHEEVCANGDIERVVSVAGGPLAHNTDIRPTYQKLVTGAAQVCFSDILNRLLLTRMDLPVNPLVLIRAIDTKKSFWVKAEANLHILRKRSNRFLT